MNKIDVFVPTLNRVDYLKYTLNSILSQTYTQFNLYILDNNSNDGTEDYVRSISDDRIIYLKSDHKLTLQENWGRINNLVKSDYFIRIDDDNVIEKDFFNYSLNLLKTYNLDSVTWNHQIIYNENNLKLMFKQEDRCHILKSHELFHFTFNNLIDSNYTLYKTKSISKIINQGIYSSLLPDRFLDYRIINLVRNSNFKYGYYLKASKCRTFSTAHNSSITINYSFYRSYKNESLIQERIQNNFIYCVFKTLDEYISEYNDKITEKYLGTLFSKKLYPQIIHLFLLRNTINKDKDWISFFKINIDFLRLIFNSLRNISSRYYGKNITGFIKDVLVSFILNIFSKHKNNKSGFIPADVIHSKKINTSSTALREFDKQLINSQKLLK